MSLKEDPPPRKGKHHGSSGDSSWGSQLVSDWNVQWWVSAGGRGWERMEAPHRVSPSPLPQNTHTVELLWLLMGRPCSALTSRW